MIENIKKILKNNKIGNVSIRYLKNFYLKNISEEMLIKMKFRKKLNRNLNLVSPSRYNDKLQWLKLYWYDPLATQCADKYRVRDYVSEKVGAKYLNEIYGVYESVDEISYESLPSSFVLKGTHGSGFNIICKDKKNLDWANAKKNMSTWLKSEYNLGNREWVYKKIKPRIICEKYLDIGDELEMRDYRVFCFNGKAKFIAVDFNINDKSKTRRNLYTLDWKLKEEEITYPKDSKVEVPKPEILKEIIEVAEILSTPFPHARIDFYIIQGRPIFSEITFFHQSGTGEIRPIEFEEEMGNWLKLPRVYNNK